MRPSKLLASLTLAAGMSNASLPPLSKNVITKHIQHVPGASITYKKTHICETKAKAYAGYVNMPAEYLHDIQGDVPYNASIFFWYFQARELPDEAPTAIYLAGGPGESSVFGATSDGGPCYVLNDSNSTEENPWSLNKHSNVLYVDQPVTSGFSYQSMIEGTLDLLWDQSTSSYPSPITPIGDYNGTVPAENSTFLYGRFPDQDLAKTANNSVVAARTLWHFAQLWFDDFPERGTCDERISLVGNSYGGYWVTTSAAYFQRQNERIKRHALKGRHLEIDTAIINNGCIDELYQAEWYPHIAYSNTYGIEVIPQDVYIDALHNFTKPGGCRDLILQCRELGDAFDPDELALNSTVNQVCEEATVYCYTYVAGAYNAYSNRSVFDMAHLLPDNQPPVYTTGWANRAWVQEELGVMVNFTADSNLVSTLFTGITGDAFRRAGLKDIEYLLDSGVKVSLIFGDRDYRCPWLGVEQLSLAANWTGADAYKEAGYEEIRVNDSYVGGVVKQHGALSFARVFDAGHDVAYSQPETVAKIQDRSLSGHDVATGRAVVDSSFSTRGPLSSWGWKNKAPASPPHECYIWSTSSCTLDQYEAVVNGTAEIENFIVTKPVPGGGPIGVAGGIA